jgi:hypothetical protein
MLAKQVEYHAILFHRDKNMVSPILKILREHGHQVLVLITPPKYSELQPIGMVSALVKGYCAKKYHTGMTMNELDNNLKAAFDYWSEHSDNNMSLIAKVIAKTDKIAKNYAADMAACSCGFVRAAGPTASSALPRRI